jgi:hydrogenase small subunit
MKISRRDFLKLCGASAGALGLSMTELGRLQKVLANEAGPKVLWLQGSACTGCSMSFLNRISGTAPLTAKDILIDSVNLVYHPNLMSLAGDSAVDALNSVYQGGGYVLAVEGGIPTGFGGSACWAYSYRGKDVTFQRAVSDLASRAGAILCVGTCASFGGIPAAPPNPTAVQSVKAVTGKTTINIAGCPTHPDWIVYVVAQLLLGNSIRLDSFGRPSDIFTSYTVHDMCPRQGYFQTNRARSFGTDNLCLRDLGCRGPETIADCPSNGWNGGANWCIDANAPCLGCTNPNFPGSRSFYQRGSGSDGGGDEGDGSGSSGGNRGHSGDSRGNSPRYRRPNQRHDD